MSFLYPSVRYFADDVGIILKVDGILTARGGGTSHAAVTIPQLNKVGVVGFNKLHVYESEGTAGSTGTPSKAEISSASTAGAGPSMRESTKSAPTNPTRFSVSRRIYPLPKQALVDVHGQIAEPVRVAAVFIVIPAEDLGVDDGDPHGRSRQCPEKGVRQIGDMGEVDIDERRPGMVELPFDHDGRIHPDQIGRYVLLLRIDHQMLGVVRGGLPVDVVEHLRWSAGGILPALSARV